VQKIKKIGQKYQMIIDPRQTQINFNPPTRQSNGHGTVHSVTNDRYQKNYLSVGILFIIGAY
jgi:hypothetical protein